MIGINGLDVEEVDSEVILRLEDKNISRCSKTLKSKARGFIRDLTPGINRLCLDISRVTRIDTNSLNYMIEICREAKKNEVKCRITGGLYGNSLS